VITSIEALADLLIYYCRKDQDASLALGKVGTILEEVIKRECSAARADAFQEVARWHSKRDREYEARLTKLAPVVRAHSLTIIESKMAVKVHREAGNVFRRMAEEEET